MQCEHWPRFDALLGKLMVLPPHEREDILDRECSDAPEIRDELRETLADLEECDNFLEEPIDYRDVADAPPFESAEGEDRRLDRYLLEDVIGRGSAGIVYRAVRGEDPDGPPYAVKIAWGALSEMQNRRFRREQEILHRLDHPAITCCHDFGETEDGRPYIVMEYLDGDRIDRQCDAEGLNVVQRLEVFRQLCGAIEAVHSLGIVHRDVKPDNVFVTRDRRAKLLDFGIAKALHAEGFQSYVDPTGSGVCLMTLNYGSPEQVKGEAVSPATDVYSLGVLLFELLTGMLPYDVAGDWTKAVMVFDAISQHPPMRLSEALRWQERHAGESAASLLRQRAVTTFAELHTQLNGQLEAVVGRALQKEPRRRHPSAAAFASEISRHLAGGRI